MTKRNYRECDICEEKIAHSTHLRLKRFFIHGWIVRLCDYGLKDLEGSVGWRKNKVDLCESCWNDTKEYVSNRKN